MSEETKPTKIPSSYDKEVMYKQWKAGASLKDLSEKWDVNYRTMVKYKNQGKWDERKLKDLTALQERELKGKSVALAVGEDTYTKMLRILHFLADNMENQIIYGVQDENGVTVPIKTLTECIDKLLRLHKFVEHDGVQKSEVVKRKVDYTELAKLYLKAKKEGLEYDDKGHLEKVINAEYSENKDDE
jgi:hypothetical protein